MVTLFYEILLDLSWVGKMLWKDGGGQLKFMDLSRKICEKA